MVSPVIAWSLAMVKSVTRDFIYVLIKAFITAITVESLISFKHNIRYVSRLDFEPDELGILYSRSLSEVLDQVNGQLDPEKEPVETAPELQQQVQSTTERLSPKLEKMILNSPRVDNPSKRSKSPPKVVESKKSKKKVAFTTISNT